METLTNRPAAARQGTQGEDASTQFAEALAPERWCVVSRPQLLHHPEDELARVARFLDLPEIPAMARTVRAALLTRARLHMQPTAARVRDVVADPLPGDEPATGTHSLRFAEVLHRVGGVLVIAAADRVATVQLQRGRVVTDVWPSDGATALAAGPQVLMIATGRELWRLTAALDGSADVTSYALRGRLLTGGPPVVDLALASGEIWAAVQSPDPSVATWDDEDGLVVRWRPPAEPPSAGSR